MADNFTTPVADSTIFATKEIAGAQVPKNLLVDLSGANVLGEVSPTPDDNSVLGRLKTLAVTLAAISSNTDGLEGLATTLNGLVDGLEGLLGTQATAVNQATIIGHVDGIEAALANVITALGGTATAANQATIIGHVDGIESALGTANTALASIAGYLDTVEALLAAATPPGENYVGKIGGDVLLASAVPAASTTPYTAGDVIGAKLTFAGAARLAAGSGMVQSVTLYCKSAQTGPMDLLLFSSDPASTFTDNAALALAAGDFDKLIGVVHLTDWTSLGGPSLAQAANVGLPFKLTAGTAIYGALVARGTPTLASAGDIKLDLRVIPG